MPSLAEHLAVIVLCSWDRCNGTPLGIDEKALHKELIVVTVSPLHKLDSSNQRRLFSSLCGLSVLFKLIGIPDLKKDSKTVDEQLIWTEA